MLRGNLDCEQVSNVYGFYDQCVSVFGSGSRVWTAACLLFNCEWNLEQRRVDPPLMRTLLQYFRWLLSLTTESFACIRDCLPT